VIVQEAVTQPAGVATGISTTICPARCSRSRPVNARTGPATEALIAQLRQVNSEVLAVAAELASGTTETVLAKSDLELGIEALMRGLRP
jgi:hypothetical protein